MTVRSRHAYTVVLGRLPYLPGAELNREERLSLLSNVHLWHLYQLPRDHCKNKIIYIKRALPLSRYVVRQKLARVN